MESQVTPQEVNDYMLSLGDFIRHTPIIVEKTDPDDVRVRWEYDEAVLRPGGYISGPTLFNIADLCGWVLTFSTEGIIPMAVTWDCHITFVRPAIGGDVIARARQIKRGRNMIFGDIIMTIDGEPDRPVAHATISYAIPQSARDEAASTL